MANHLEQEIFMTTGEMITASEAQQASDILFAHKDSLTGAEWAKRRRALDRGDYETAIGGLEDSE